MAYNFRRGDRDQPFLLSPDLRDWLPDGHLALSRQIERRCTEDLAFSAVVLVSSGILTAGTELPIWWSVTLPGAAALQLQPHRRPRGG